MQKRFRQRQTRNLVLIGMDRAVPRLGADGFAEIMHQRAEHEPVGILRAAAQLRRFVQYHHGVCPYIAFGVVYGFCPMPISAFNSGNQ